MLLFRKLHENNIALNGMNLANIVLIAKNE
jgi:hypothetical protein